MVNKMTKKQKAFTELGNNTFYVFDGEKMFGTNDYVKLNRKLCDYTHKNTYQVWMLDAINNNYILTGM